MANIDPEALYQQLGHIVATAPDLTNGGWATTEGRLWLGRAAALVEAVGNYADTAMFNIAAGSLGGVARAQYAHEIMVILNRALAKAELAAPASARGSFLPAGEPFSAINAVAKVLGSAKASALIVDPYADGNLLTEFAVLLPNGVPLQVLADEADHKPALKSVAAAYCQQYGNTRPLEVRLAPAKTLHDRIILIDGREAWSLGQSFNALAKRAPTSLVRADAETAALKVSAYGAMWAVAKSLL